MQARPIAHSAGLTDASGQSTYRAEAVILADARKGAARTIAAALEAARE